MTVTATNGDWATASIDSFGEDAGKTAIAISLKFEAPEGVTDYAVNIGQMGFTTNRTAPAAVSKVTLDEAIYPTDKTMEARVYWEEADNAFMYRIFRIHQDGTREFIGATPNTAFYLGSLNRDGNEAVCTFEIIPYSENCVKGTAKQFTIDWPAAVADGFVEAWDEGANLALNCPVVSSVATEADGSARLLTDGVIPGSKWCVNPTKAYAVVDLGENKKIQRWVVWHANCPGAGESPDMNTVDFDLQYAVDDGKERITGDDAASRNRVKTMQFTVADTVTGNKQDITDFILNEPITARYLKLNVTKSDNSAWHAVRIYEFQVYETGRPGVRNNPSPYERNVTVKNLAGATDTVVVDAELAAAYAGLRFVNHAQRLGELCAAYEAKHLKDTYTEASYEVFQAALDAAKEIVTGKNSSAYEAEQSRIALEAAVRQLKLATAAEEQLLRILTAHRSLPPTILEPTQMRDRRSCLTGILQIQIPGNGVWRGVINGQRSILDRTKRSPG